MPAAETTTVLLPAQADQQLQRRNVKPPKDHQQRSSTVPVENDEAIHVTRTDTHSSASSTVAALLTAMPDLTITTTTTPAISLLSTSQPTSISNTKPVLLPVAPFPRATVPQYRGAPLAASRPVMGVSSFLPQQQARYSQSHHPPLRHIAPNSIASSPGTLPSAVLPASSFRTTSASLEPAGTAVPAPNIGQSLALPQTGTSVYAHDRVERESSMLVDSTLGPGTSETVTVTMRTNTTRTASVQPAANPSESDVRGSGPAQASPSTTPVDPSAGRAVQLDPSAGRAVSIKLLLPHYCAGSVIGRAGSAIAKLEVRVFAFVCEVPNQPYFCYSYTLSEYHSFT